MSRTERKIDGHTRPPRPRGIGKVAKPDPGFTFTIPRTAGKKGPSMDEIAEEERLAFEKANKGAYRKGYSRKEPSQWPDAFTMVASSERQDILAQAAEANPYSYGDVLLATRTFAGMPFGLKQYRSDNLVQRCADIRSSWCTRAGYDIVLEPTQQIDDPVERENFLKKYSGLKTYLELCSKQVGLSNVLKNQRLLSLLNGYACAQIVWNNKNTTRLRIGDPKMIVQLRPDFVAPLIAADREFKGISYKGQGDLANPAYVASELLYFTNKDFFGDKVGISEIESILWIIDARARILQDDLPEAVTAQWCATILWFLDREKLPPDIKNDPEAVRTLIRAHINAVKKPAKHIVSTTQFERPPTVVATNPNLDMLLNVKRELDREIMRKFEVPRFLAAAEEEVNKATALPVISSFIEGTVTDDQAWQKDFVEAQWFDPLSDRWLIANGEMQKDEIPPIQARYEPRELRYEDWLALMHEISIAKNAGWLSTKKAFEMMQKGRRTSFDPAEVQEETGPPDQPLDLFLKKRKMMELTNLENVPPPDERDLANVRH